MTWQRTSSLVDSVDSGGHGVGFCSCRIDIVMNFVEGENMAEDLQVLFDASSDERSREGNKENLGITDPRLEYQDPTPSIHELFVRLDKQYFWGRLGMVEVKWSKRMTRCAGMCCYQGRRGLCSIKLSAPLLSLRPRKDLVETLLHEMIHAYLFITQDRADREDHGPNFRDHMDRINREAGTDITIYHSFHNEVAYYQKHVWRCNGRCRGWRPFFGFVRRTMNRAPGPNDSWWHEHQLNCGGVFIKISEPEKEPEKPKKKNEPEKEVAVVDLSEIRSLLEFWRAKRDETRASTSFNDNPPGPQSAKIMRVTSDFNKSSTQTKPAAQTSGTPDQANVPNLQQPPTKPETSTGRSDARDEKGKNEHLSVRATVRNVWASKYPSPSRTEPKPNDSNPRSPITIQMKRREVSCPVCSESFSETSINEHVEECLSKTECVEILNETAREKETKKPEPQRGHEDSLDGKLVPCPVCRKVMLGKTMDEHLDACLNISFDDVATVQDDEPECESVPCPCCQKWVPEESINEHIDECLARAEGGSSN